jgi:phosphate-selective porin
MEEWKMTDKELIKLAAKAAGISKQWDGSLVDKENPNRVWSPLTGDGDALRLAVKLHMQVSVTTESCRAETLPCLGVRVNDSDENLATRRAIVMAAAAIGKEME